MQHQNKENIQYYVNDLETATNNNVDCSLDLIHLMAHFESIEDEGYGYERYIDDDAILSEIKNYDLNYTVKQLLQICEYYNLMKSYKNMKKQHLITAIMMFEKNPQHAVTVERRKSMWFYMNEIKNDKAMKRYILWQ